jgi:hypothetical protein
MTHVTGGKDFFVYGWEGECRGGNFYVFLVLFVSSSSYDIRHKYMTVVMLICVSVVVWVLCVGS